GRQGNMQVAIAQSPEPAAAATPTFVMPMPLPGFRLAQLVAANGAQSQVPAIQPMPEPLVASAAPLPVPVPAPQPVNLGQQAAEAANVLAAPTQLPPNQDVIGAWLSDGYKLGAPPAALGQTAPSAPLGYAPQSPIDPSLGQPIDPSTSGSVQTAEAAVPPGGWVVQIGAGPSEESARAMLSDAAGKAGTLGDFRSYVERFEKNGKIFYRARFIGFGDRDDATAMCNQLKQQNLSCLAMQG
ncbi:MAG TPA: SPOR domain-containing protein, partial [Devosia sp.]